MAKKRVGILFGGKSVEHEVSIQSARNVSEAIDKAKYDVVLIGIDKAGRWLISDRSRLNAAASPAAQLGSGASDSALTISPGASTGTFPALDVIFPLIHGTGGEDGTLQGLLKLADIPFVGPDVLGSAIGMDKDVAKRLLRDAGIPVSPFLTLTPKTAASTSFEFLAEKFRTPFFVKPAGSGSSVGVSKVRSAAEWSTARAEALRYDRKLLVEEYIPGKEVEVAVLGNDDPVASVPGEISAQHDFYSYEAKYLDENGAKMRIPADLPAETSEWLRKLAIQTFLTLECAGMGRVDFFVREGGGIYVNEINTIPGFTKISMYPKLWEATGLSYPNLIDRLIELAFERHAAARKLETSIK
jgi:D-alanine-D-alanine ligase